MLHAPDAIGGVHQVDEPRINRFAGIETVREPSQWSHLRGPQTDPKTWLLGHL
jgi:hypothetical protein